MHNLFLSMKLLLPIYFFQLSPHFICSFTRSLRLNLALFRFLSLIFALNYSRCLSFSHKDSRLLRSLLPPRVFFCQVIHPFKSMWIRPFLTRSQLPFSLPPFFSSLLFPTSFCLSSLFSFSSLFIPPFFSFSLFFILLPLSSGRAVSLSPYLLSMQQQRQNSSLYSRNTLASPSLRTHLPSHLLSLLYM